MMQKLSLPIDAYCEQIAKAFTDYSTILVKASPGSGKTTRLPWYLAKNLNKRVAVLEPRRLAAKLAAQRICDEEGLRIGEEIGYHFRFENQTSPKTKVTFYTEGTFLKKFLLDPQLKEFDIVILDEFHERHLDTDLALAFLRQLQNQRKDLKIMLMSATLDLNVIDTFTSSTIIEVEGVLFPVEIQFLPNQPSVLNQKLEQKVWKAVDSLLDDEGDILIFLPGMREMLQVQNILNGPYEVHLLHADLSKDKQHQALLPSQKRKIILATNIAESSVTIPGIKIVIDSGIQREAYYSPWNGLKFIQDAPITKSSAIQRAGRAGRTGPGKCLRLYSQQDYNEREEFTIPEIEKADLTDTCLLVHGIGIAPMWFRPPPTDKWERAVALCETLGAIKEGALTPVGKKMLGFPLEARLSRVLIEGEELPLHHKRTLLKFICENIENDNSGILFQRLKFYLDKDGNGDKTWEECLLVGFIDQVGRLRKSHHDLIHYSGKTLKLHSSLKDIHEDYFIIFDITKRQEAIQVLPILEEWLFNVDPFPFTEDEEIETKENIFIKRKTKLGSIVIEETPLKITWNELSDPLKSKIIVGTKTQFQKALALWKESPIFGRFHYWAKINGLNADDILGELSPGDYFNFHPSLTWSQIDSFFHFYLESKLNIQNIDSELPTKIFLKGKRELIVHYPIGMEPYLEAPIQDFYGMNETPAILHGRGPLILKLLGPHKRPIQVTQDLAGFWKKTYQEMKKSYQRDYPRHYWPDEPWEARPVLLKRLLDS